MIFLRLHSKHSFDFIEKMQRNAMGFHYLLAYVNYSVVDVDDLRTIRDNESYLCVAVVIIIDNNVGFTRPCD